MTEAEEALEQLRHKLKVLRAVTRDALIAVAQAEEILSSAQPEEAQRDRSLALK